MTKKGCELCKRHRARWLVEIRDIKTGKKFRAKVCGICKWKLWPSPRKTKKLVVTRVITNIRGVRRIIQPHVSKYGQRGR